MSSISWNIPPSRPVPQALVQAGCTPLLALVLSCRGIETPEQAAEFLSDGSFELESPLLLPDMEAAADRLRRAIENRETVAVYGDYDVDGITSACLLYDYLSTRGVRVEIYIPNRLGEGYGVNRSAITKLQEKGVSLLVTVDCGITAMDETDYARSLGMDVIITDHHECQDILPNAVAVVDPKRDENNPARNLAGVGVAFKLVCALSGEDRTMLNRYADLVAVGTIADVMPLLGENRKIAKYGLAKLRTMPRPGLGALMEQAGIEPERLNASSIGFVLAPRINAAGRLGHAGEATRLLLEQEPSLAQKYAVSLCDLNRERQQLEADIWQEAGKMLARRQMGQPIVLAKEGWHQGVIGIVASRLADAWHAPAIMISLDGDRGKGSGRSWGGFNLFDALSACGAYLDSFGGHAQAAGLNIKKENIDAFRESFCAYYAAHAPQEEAVISPDILVEDPELLSMRCVESLDLLEPCGTGNPRPLLCLRSATLLNAVSIGGGKHTKLQLEKRKHYYDCVWFSQPLGEIRARLGDRVDVVFSPQTDDFRGRRSIQLVLTDLRQTDMGTQCLDILTNGPFSDTHLTRREISHLWRSLARAGQSRVPLARLNQITDRLQSTQIALGLRVFYELGLVQLHLLPDQVEYKPLPWEEKVQLDSSPSWQAQKLPERTAPYSRGV